MIISTRARTRRRFLLALLAMVAAGSVSARAGGAVQGRAAGLGLDEDSTPHSEVRLVSAVGSVQPGESFHAALHVTLDDGWHTYWINAGDAGLPLYVTWDLPEGVEAGPLEWPAPHLIPVPPLASYGYEGQLLLPVEISTPAGLRPGDTLRLAGETDFLVCAYICLPASGSVELKLPVRATRGEADPDWGAAIRDVRSRIPRPAVGWTARAWTDESGYVVELEPKGETPSGEAAPGELPAPYLFVDSTAVVRHAAPQRVLRSESALRLHIPRDEFAVEDTPYLAGVIVADVEAGSPRSWWIEAEVDGVSPPQGGFASAPAEFTGGVAEAARDGDGAARANTAVGRSSGEVDLGLVLALVFAFGGGLLLNLMPCVFPVLSVKVLGFVRHGGGDPAAARRHGLLFGAGVLISFWMLAGALLALRAGGETLGWGFQLQSPGIVAALAVLLFGLGLNLSGLFEVGLGFTRLGGVGSDDGALDSFLTGGLTVIVATPCTAPFMGAALGFALVRPAPVGFAVFTALALGLAAPYVLLSFAPRILERLPAPGAWMETVRQALAFPLYATVVWLVWVFGRQAGIDATGLLLLALAVLAFGGWLYGRGAGAGRAWAAALRIGAAAALAVGAALAVQGTLLAEPPSEVRGVAGDVVREDFTSARVEQLRSEGRAVFIDFTAAWCLSCQVNERVALGTRAVRDAFAEHEVALLEADWTNRDAEIARAITSFGRSGVPLYVLYPADGGEPEILPAVLTPGIVIDAVRRAAG